MSIFEVQHQPRAHRMIQRAMASHRMPHAYLFAGPEGVGKEMLAERLARILLCESPTQVETPADWNDAGIATATDACGQCPDCTMAAAGTHPDLHLIHRQLNKQHPDPTIRRQKALFLTVDVIRHFVIERSMTRASRGRSKVFIIREAERMNEAAQNSLLKTLEEPPSATVIILLCNALDRMLPTTRSRCQPVIFQTLPTEFVAEQLRQQYPQAAPAEIGYAARFGQGSLEASGLFIEDGGYALKQQWAERLVSLLAGGARIYPTAYAKPLERDAQELGKLIASRDPDVSDTDATRQGLRVMLVMLANFFVDALRQVSGAGDRLINADQTEVIEQLAGGQSVRTLTAILGDLSRCEADINRNAQTTLTLEALWIRLTRHYRGQRIPA